MVYVLDSAFMNASFKIKVHSLLRVPSITSLQRSNFSHDGINDKQHEMFLELYNPYVLIGNCIFDGMSLWIATHFKQDLFYIEISLSYFIKVQKEGNGGALYVSSSVPNSRVNLSSVTFMGNRAVKLSHSNPGKGGALYAEGELMLILIENSLFINNSAV